MLCAAWGFRGNNGPIFHKAIVASRVFLRKLGRVNTITHLEGAPPLLRARDVARRLSSTARYVLLLAQRGELKSVRLGKKAVRFRPEDVEELIERSAR